MREKEKPLVWLHGEIKTPPLSTTARIEAGYLLRQLQNGTILSLPHSRPMPVIGKQCHELRINDENKTEQIDRYLDEEMMPAEKVIFEKDYQLFLCFYNIYYNILKLQ